MNITKLFTFPVLAAVLGLGTGAINGQTIYQWNGTTDTNWTTAGNWAASPGMGYAGSITNARLNVYNGAGNPLAYTAAQGTTIYTNAASRGLVIASAGYAGAMNIVGGTFESRGAYADVLANGYTGSLTIAGGQYINTNAAGSGTLDLCFAASSGTLNVNSGSAYVNVITFSQVGGNSGPATINLNGGLLGVVGIDFLTGALGGLVPSTLNFNGGTLQAIRDAGSITSVVTSGTATPAIQTNTIAVSAVNVLAGGAIIDSQGFTANTTNALLHGGSGVDGGLTKLGAGTLTLFGQNTYNGPTLVQSGTLNVQAASTGGGAYTNCSGGALGVTVEAAGQTLAMSSLTESNQCANTFNLGALGDVTSPVIYAAKLAVSGTIRINVTGSGFTVGQFSLIKYGSQSGLTAGSFVAGSLPFNGYISNNVANSSVDVVDTTLAGTAMTLSSPINPSAYGQSVTFTATIFVNGTTAVNSAGNVVFSVDGNPVATNGVTTGSATYTTSGLAVETHAINANYLGNANYGASSGSLAGGQTVNPAASGATTTTTLVSSPNPSNLGQIVTFTATVQTNGTTAGNATSFIVFSVDGVPAATNAVANGVAAYAANGLAQGTHTVAAAYLGDGNYAASSSVLSGGQVVYQAVTTMATTATFRQAGTYVFAARVVGPSGSSFTNIQVTVQQTPTGLSVSGGQIYNAIQGMPYDVFAFEKDQFGLRMNTPPTNGSLPDIVWSANDNGGAFTLVSSNGEEAAYYAASNTTGWVTITATGANGYTGTGAMATDVFADRPPTVVGIHLFNISQTGAGRPITFTATVNDPATSAGSNYTDVLTYDWVVTGTPPGGSLTLNANNYPQAIGTATGAGTYTVRLKVTDSSGASVSESQPLLVDAQGTATGLPVITFLDYNGNITTNLSTAGNIDEMLTIQPDSFSYVNQWQWQISTNGGSSWQNVAGATNAMLAFEPVAAANDVFQVVGSNALGSTTSIPINLSVWNASTLDFAATNVSVSQTVGSVSIPVMRLGSSAGAQSLTWTARNGSAVLGADYTISSGTINWANGDSANKAITIPIVNNGLAQNGKYFYVNLSGCSGNAGLGTTNQCVVTILDALGQATFAQSAATVNESAGSVALTVSRTNGNSGALTVNYAALDGSAVAGVNYVATSNTLTWANGDSGARQIIIPLLVAGTLNTNAQFTVALIASNSAMVGPIASQTVTVREAPYKQWLGTYWPSYIPAVPVYNSLPAAILSHSPLFYFRFGETSGNTVNGVNASGATMAAGVLSNTAPSSYGLGYAGPRPPAWPGLETSNYALSFTASGSNSLPPQFTSGASANCGAANGLGSILGKGFTFVALVNTSVTDRQMNLVGGARLGKTNTTFNVTLNRAFNNSTTAVPHALRIYLQPDAASTNVFEYSVVLTNLPTGSLCDGQWHFLAITVPYFSGDYDAEYPHFYFDGAEGNALSVRGAEYLDSRSPFSDFSDTGFRIGADGSTNPVSFFSGAVDEIAFIPSVLAAGDIANIVAAQAPAATPAFMAPAGSPAGDGVPNLLKYALGLNPLAALNGGPGQPIATLSGQMVNINFTRMPYATDITYHVDSRAGLQTGAWSEVWNTTTNPYSGNPAMLLINPSTATNPAGFFRLRITQP